MRQTSYSFVNVCFNLLQKKQPSQYVTKSSYESVQSINRKLTFVPIVFVLLRIWGTIRFIFVLLQMKEYLNNPVFLALHVSVSHCVVLVLNADIVD